MMILKMLQEGKINADQAAKLLEALEAGKPASSKEENEEKTGKWFRVRVTDAITGIQKTNIRIPIGLVNAGFSIGAQFSPEFAQLNSNDLMNFIKSGKTGLILDVIDDDDDEHVEIFIE
ncbi:MAG TPA: hypothetical protein PLL88_05880 [Anaerolineaceae bacterium]|nr:hypothetical protein [Anaerolineaceae bacterium]